MTERAKLFVYGSLKRGFRHHAELGDAEFVGEARTVPGYELAELGAYPALKSGGAGTVAGEIFAIDQQRLAVLDAFEGPEYERRAIELANGITAQAYFLRRS